MSFPSQITTNTAQQTQPESPAASPQKSHAASAPPTGSKADHPALYNSKRPLGAQGLSGPPMHIRCLGEQDRKTYIGLWNQLPGVPSHWSKKPLSAEERHEAMANIDMRQQLDERCGEILKSHPDDGPLSKSLVQKSLEQSEASLKTVWAALQTNRAIFGAPRAKL